MKTWYIKTKKAEVSNITIIIILVIILALIGLTFVMKQANNFKAIVGM